LIPFVVHYHVCDNPITEENGIVVCDGKNPVSWVSLFEPDNLDTELFTADDYKDDNIVPINRRTRE